MTTNMKIQNVVKKHFTNNWQGIDPIEMDDYFMSNEL